jgi:hypothetical protein
MEEDGGVNLYAFVGNDVVNMQDMLGLWGWFEEFLEDFVAPACAFCAGASDSLTMGASAAVRKEIGGDYGEITDEHKAVYKKGEYTEVAIEIALTGGSAALKHAAREKIAKEVAKKIASEADEEVTEAAAKKLAAEAKKRIDDRLRREARKAMDRAKGEVIHHINTLSGHPAVKRGRGYRLSYFPTLVVEWSANSKMNLMKIPVNKPNLHVKLHKRAWGAENIVMKSSHPLLTGTRTLLNINRENQTKVNVELKCIE